MNMANKVPIVQATFYNNNTKQIENCYPMTSAKGVVMSDGKTLEESFSDKADDSVVVHKSGDEEILGRKTFEELEANGLHLSDDGDWSHRVSAFYSFLEEQGVIKFGTEEDWSVILRNLADPEYDYDAATKNYVDTKISSTEENLVHKDGYERITAIKQFQKGIGVGLFNSLVANEDRVDSGAWLDREENPAPFIVADPTADDHAATKYYVDEGLATKQDTLTAGNGISIKGNVISAIGGGVGDIDSLITPITYVELVALRDSSSLVAGMQYRITDYACTTTQENTQSAGHPFDIIVTADSENTLNEKARAIQHEGDTYFADCDLNAWKIWYCLDNDNTRFLWADSTNGKGVIYRMIDEWNNDVPYDFKNIQFARDWSAIAPDSGLAGTIYCYTFSVFLNGFSENATANDESIKAKKCIKSDGEGRFGNNVVRTYQNLGIYSLNDIVFFTDWTGNSIYHFSNTLGGSCVSTTFGNDCFCNTFGNDCHYNTFGNNCHHNTFGNNCHHNTFGNECNSNSFGNNCYYNSFGDDCDSTTFGNYCFYIKFATSSSATTKYNYYRHNHFGDGCQFIVFKGAETASDSTQVQNYNFAQGLQGELNAYLTIDGVRSRAYETKVAKNSSGELKIYCEADLIQ